MEYKEEIISDQDTVGYKCFLGKILPNYSHVRVGVKHSEPPFENVYFKVSKKEVNEIIRMGQMTVTFSIMYNSRVKKDLKDVLYINKLRQTLI